MSVLYLHTAPKPRLQDTDAIFQETALLRSRFGGKEVVLFPFLNPSSYLPRFAYGWHKYLEISRIQDDVFLNHVFSPGLYYFPILKVLKKPIVYSITASIRDADINSNLHRFSSLAKIIINNSRDFDKLRDRGLRNLALVPPGLKVDHFHPSRLPLDEKFVLLMASAPWESTQFDTKGIDLLLRVIKKMPNVQMVFLWRGSMLEELLDRIHKYGVMDQVEVINRKVVIQEVLDRVHATVLIAKSGALVKSYPHSLIESLACAKPVLISNVISMADYIQKEQCGLVLEHFNQDKLIELIWRLKADYSTFRGNAERVGAQDFSAVQMLKQIAAIYDEFISK